MSARTLQTLGLTALLAGCASMETAKAPAPKAAPPEAAAKAEPAAKPEETAGPKHRERTAKKGMRTLPTRPLNVKADCSFKDPTGYRGTMKLDVKEAKVGRFEASLDIPPYGSCRFDLKDFRQTEEMPNPLLKAGAGGCEVRMWEQGRRVTVAFSRCRDMCTSTAAFERLWPILADSGNGSCG